MEQMHEVALGGLKEEAASLAKRQAGESQLLPSGWTDNVVHL